jgi:hypothetical protein
MNDDQLGALRKALESEGAIISAVDVPRLQGRPVRKMRGVNPVDAPVHGLHHAVISLVGAAPSKEFLLGFALQNFGAFKCSVKMVHGSSPLFTGEHTPVRPLNVKRACGASGHRCRRLAQDIVPPLLTTGARSSGVPKRRKPLDISLRSSEQVLPNRIFAPRIAGVSSSTSQGRRSSISMSCAAFMIGGSQGFLGGNRRSVTSGNEGDMDAAR